MTSLLFTLAIFAALAAMGLRRYRSRRRRKALLERPGATLDNPIYVRSFDEMDEHLRSRWCGCGGFLEVTGEGSREQGGHRYRVTRVRCQECEEMAEVFFDTTDLLQ